MLTLSRFLGEKIVIGDPDNPLGVVKVVAVQGDKVRLWFEFPLEIKINREEVAKEIVATGGVG